MIQAGWTRWLQEPPLSRHMAMIGAVALVALPSLVRAAVNGHVAGCEFTPYLPFVLLAAILLRWWQAALVALASVAVLSGLFFAPMHDRACFISSSGLFLASSAMMIVVAHVVRRLFNSILGARADESSDGVLFSLEDGQVWASWYGHETPMRLGSQQRVSRMMKDFLAQEEVGKRFKDRE